jgi:hypothetical protein
MAFNGTGSNVTSLNAENISSGTLAVGRGGTGATTLNAAAVIIGNGTSAPTFVAPGTSGNILTSNGTAWTSATPAGGGVTSLNGQTGAITNTTFGNIGSVAEVANCSATSYIQGQTVAGTSLFYPNTITSSSISIVYSNGDGSGVSWTGWSILFTRVTRQAAGNTGFQNPLGATALSGTWRIMGFVGLRAFSYDSCTGYGQSVASMVLAVRVS